MKHRLIELDVLRGAAILMVLACHLPVDVERVGWFKQPFVLVRDFGVTGVNLFFVISGYLVGGLLMAEVKATGRLDAPRFLARRAFKIWPGYYCILACLFLAELCYGEPAGVSVRRLVPGLMHSQNYHVNRRAVHTWSLAVEEHFYLALPLLLPSLLKSRRAVPAFAALLLVACAAARHAAWSAGAGTEIFYRTHLCMDSLFVGVALAEVAYFQPDLFAALARRRRLLLAVGLALLAPTALARVEGSWADRVLGPVALSLGYACVLTFAVTSRPAVGASGWFLGTLVARWVAMVGASSYSIYLWHWYTAAMPVYHVNKTGLPWRLTFLPDASVFLLIAAAYLCLAVIPGVALGRLIDLPALRLRDRLVPPFAAGPPSDRPVMPAGTRPTSGRVKGPLKQRSRR